MNKIHEFSIESIADLLALFTNDYNSKDKIYLGDNTLFRGQQDSTWVLEPKIARIGFRFNSKDEIEMLETFKQYSVPFLDKEYYSDWDYLAIAQHHGMSTRLLDWTTNPLAALWFCVREPIKHDFGSIWVLNYNKNEDFIPNKILTNLSIPENDLNSPFKVDSIKVIRPQHINPRIINQNGWFTVHGKINDDYLELSKDPNFYNKLYKVNIPKTAFSSIRSNLDNLAVNNMTLFPDLDGVAAYSQWLNSTLSDELSWLSKNKNK